MARRPVNIETLTHNDRRANIPTAELESVVADELREPIRVACARRNPYGMQGWPGTSAKREHEFQSAAQNP